MDMREAFEEYKDGIIRLLLEENETIAASNVHDEESFRTFEAGWQAALSHLGDGSKAEPVGYISPQMLESAKKQQGKSGPQHSFTSERIGLCQIPLYTHPAPTAQDSSLSEREKNCYAAGFEAAKSLYSAAQDTKVPEADAIAEFLVNECRLSDMSIKDLSKKLYYWLQHFPSQEEP